MHAIIIERTGGPEAMRYAEIATPEPGPGEVRIHTEAIGVNYIDVYYRTGAYKAPKLPFTPGMEAAGTVDAVGEGVTSMLTGARVAYAGVLGSYAEYTIAPAERVVYVPEGISSEDAAALMLQGMTAQYLSHDTFPLKPGDVALVHAAAGGVGLLLVQMAKERGATVIGAAGTEEKAALAREHGADHTIVYTEQDFSQEARRLTGGRGVDVVYDSVGRATFEHSLDALRPRGMVVIYGQSSGAVPPFDVQTLSAKGSLYVTRPTIANYVATRAELEARAAACFAMVREGKLHVRIGARFPLADAADAHRALESRSTTGKIVLLP